MTRTQIGVFVGSGAGLAITLALFAAAGAGLIDIPEAWRADRVRLGAGCCLAIGIALVLQIGEIAGRRFFVAADTGGAGLGDDTLKTKMLRAIAQNTLEQSVLALIAYAGAAAFAPAHLLALAPACAGCFLTGRVLFRFGYAHGAPWRAPGFALTFYPTIGLYVLVLAQGL